MTGFFSVIDQYNKEIIICFLDKLGIIHSEMLFLLNAHHFLKSMPDSYPVKNNPFFLIYTYASPCERCLETYSMLSIEYPTYHFDIFYTQRYKKNCISSLLYTKYSETDINFANSFSFPLLDKSYFAKQCSKFINVLSNTLYTSYLNNKNKDNKSNTIRLLLKSQYNDLNECSESIYKEIIKNQGEIKKDYFPNFNFENIELLEKNVEIDIPLYIYDYKYLREKIDEFSFIWDDKQHN